MAKLSTCADHSFAALDAVYAREGGTGILELGGASDARIVVWTKIRGLRLEEFEERKQQAQTYASVFSAFRYLHTGLAPRIIGELLGPSDRRVMRIVSRKWRAHLDKPGWRAEEATQEERINKLAAGVQDLTRMMQGHNWVYELYPRRSREMIWMPRAMVHKTVQEWICALHDELEAELAEYSGGRAMLVAGLVRSIRETPSPAVLVAGLINDTWRRFSQRGVQTRLGRARSQPLRASELQLPTSSGLIEEPQEGAVRTLFGELVDVREKLAAARRRVEELQALVAQDDPQLVDAADPTDDADRWLAQSTYNFLLRARRSVAELEEKERAIAQTEARLHAAVQEVLDAAGRRDNGRKSASGSST